jgi:hypothetical protein
MNNDIDLKIGTRQTDCATFSIYEQPKFNDLDPKPLF